MISGLRGNRWPNEKQLQFTDQFMTIHYLLADCRVSPSSSPHMKIESPVHTFSSVAAEGILN